MNDERKEWRLWMLYHHYQKRMPREQGMFGWSWQEISNRELNFDIRPYLGLHQTISFMNHDHPLPTRMYVSIADMNSFLLLFILLDPDLTWVMDTQYSSWWKCTSLSLPQQLVTVELVDFCSFTEEVHWITNIGALQGEVLAPSVMWSLVEIHAYF